MADVFARQLPHAIMVFKRDDQTERTRMFAVSGGVLS